MKRLILVAAMALTIPFLMGAAPVAPIAGAGAASPVLIAAQTIDTDWTGTWEAIGTMVFTQTDSCISVYTMQCTAALDPGDKLYVGFRIMGGAGAAATDTFIYEWPAEARQSVSRKISFSICDTLLSQTDDLDSVFVSAAIRGSTRPEYVFLTNIQLIGGVVDIGG